MHRRHLLRSALALASAWSLPAFAGTGPEVVVLWPGAPPGGGGPGGPLRVTRSGRVTDVAAPILEVFRPSAVSVAPNGAAVLVASGGGYKAVENGKEGYPAAAWLAARGVTAFVLTYRLPGEGWGAGRLAPFQDAQRAMRLIRSDPAVDRARVGALGFSAGGHLMGMTAAWPEHRLYEPVDAADAHSVRPDARPDAVALIYPVITLEPPYDATSTRRQLVGDDPSAALSAEWSVQTHVRRAMPATFLAQAADDAVSNPENTAIMEAACRAAGVPVERHLYSSGGHGFGMGRPGTPTVAWPDRYEAWLRARGMVG